jgi:hypothetical protein
MRTVKINVSRQANDDQIPAILVIVATGNPTTHEMFVAFKHCVQLWLTKTVQGRNACKEACDRFNYGDFIQWDLENSKTFKRYLGENGIVKAYIESLGEVEDIGVSYDDVFHPLE